MEQNKVMHTNETESWFLSWQTSGKLDQQNSDKAKITSIYLNNTLSLEGKKQAKERAF
jgi:hypothetical protein